VLPGLVIDNPFWISLATLGDDCSACRPSNLCLSFLFFLTLPASALPNWSLAAAYGEKCNA